jgi:hypothetical protein
MGTSDMVDDVWCGERLVGRRMFGERTSAFMHVEKGDEAASTYISGAWGVHDASC